MDCCSSRDPGPDNTQHEANRPVSNPHHTHSHRRATRPVSSRGRAIDLVSRETQTAGFAKANPGINYATDNLKELGERFYHTARALQRPPGQHEDPLDACISDMMQYVTHHLDRERNDWVLDVNSARFRANRLSELLAERDQRLITQNLQIQQKDSDIRDWIAFHNREDAKLRRQHGDELQKRSEEALDEREALEKRAENNRIALQRAWDEDVQKLTRESETQAREHEVAITSLESEHALKITSLESEHALKITSLESEHASKITKAENEMKDLRREMDARLKQEIAKHRAAVTLLDQEYAADIKEHQEKARADKESLTMSHKNATAKIRQQNQQLNDVLLTQDQDAYLPSLFKTTTLPGEADKGMKSKFMDIYRLVEDLSRTVWKEPTDIWTLGELQKACTRQTDRSVKQALLQDMIWSILFVHVFCSPFRMFGGTGRQLELEWARTYNTTRDSQSRVQQDLSSERAYRAPPPSVQAERWRYMTLMGCREALESQLSSQDSRAAIKLGWSKSQSDMIKEMKTELLKVVDAQEIKSGQIKRLCETAAKVWLDLVMHRCRVEISMMGPACSAAEKRHIFNDLGSLTVTRTPSVGRHGDSKGGKLEKFTFLADCAGDALAIP